MSESPARPVIVCGMPRTGTSLAGQFLKTAGVLIYPEFSPEAVPSMFPLIGEVKAMLVADAWRGFDEAVVQGRALEFVRRIWAAGRPLSGAQDEGLARFGLKQPGAERFAGAFRDTLGPLAPHYVYTYRDPVDAYESTMRTMLRWGDIGPDVYADRWDDSLDAALELRSAGDLVLFDVAAATLDRSARDRIAAGILDFLGLEPTRKTNNFLTRWPGVNTSAGRNLGELPDDEIARRVTSFKASRRGVRLVRRVARFPAR